MSATFRDPRRAQAFRRSGAMAFIRRELSLAAEIPEDALNQVLIN
jgi:hypothetical protein